MKLKRWFPVWIFPVLLVLSVATVWLRLLVVRTTYDLNQVDNEIKNSQVQKENLDLKLASLRSPARLEVLAKSRFGLSPPKPGQTIHLKQSSGK